MNTTKCESQNKKQYVHKSVSESASLETTKSNIPTLFTKSFHDAVPNLFKGSFQHIFRIKILNGLLDRRQPMCRWPAVDTCAERNTTCETGTSAANQTGTGKQNWKRWMLNLTQITGENPDNGSIVEVITVPCKATWTVLYAVGCLNRTASFRARWCCYRLVSFAVSEPRLARSPLSDLADLTISTPGGTLSWHATEFTCRDIGEFVTDFILLQRWLPEEKI